MDDLDREILRHLNGDARMSYRDLAREVGVSIGTVSARVKRLESEGVILGYAPILDGGKLGYDVMAVLGLRISKGKLLEVQRRIAKDDRIHACYDVTGEWDSILIVRVRSVAELDKFIKRVLAMENVERTNTQVVLNVVKEERRTPV